MDYRGVPALQGVKLAASKVDYKSRILELCHVDGCLPELYLQLHHSSIHPFRFESTSSKTNSSVAFFNCSLIESQNLRNDDFQEQDLQVCPIYVAASKDCILRKDVTFCSKIKQLDSPLNPEDFASNTFRLRWSQPKCDGENKLKQILFKYVIPASGTILLVLGIVFLVLIYRHFKTKGDDLARLEKFLKNYEALKPTRFSYSDLKRITNNFKDKIGEGAHGSVFKGKLSNQIIVAVKVLNNSDDDGKEFINEVGTMAKIHHINVGRLLGFCAQGFHRALVYDFFPNGSLKSFVCSPDNKEKFLGWMKLHQIALGIAKGIEYLHHDCDYRILHFDINPSNVLLDHNFAPKISDFGLAKLCSKTQSVVSITTAKGTPGYIAPKVFSKNFGNVSYK